MAWTLDLGPLVHLQKRMWRVALLTGLSVYLQGILAFVLLTELTLSVPAFAAAIGVLIAQGVQIHRPVRQLLSGDLVRRMRRYVVLIAVFVAVIAIGSRGGDERAAGVIVAVLVTAPGIWGAVGATRLDGALRSKLAALHDTTVLMELLSFSPREALRARSRSFGGDLRRWVVLIVAACVAFTAVAAPLAFLARAFGVNAGTPVVQAATFTAILVFYIVMRRLKLSASQLRQRDPRPPVLILRKFGDDFLDASRLGFGATPTFEHFVASELNRIGPVVAIGRPGERLQPLGASREYLTGDDWKAAVGTTIDDAAMTAFVLGDSENVLWEFRAAIERGKKRTLIIVPPLTDRVALARRWARFAAGAADALGAGFPAELPARQVLAIGFVGEDAVMMVSDEKPRSRAMFSRSRSDYRLVFRLFECLMHRGLPSARALELFLTETTTIGLSESV